MFRCGDIGHGYGFDRDHVERARIGEASAFAAVTGADNSKLMSARIARETFAVLHVVARIYDPRRAEIYERLGITTVTTVTWTPERVFRRVFPQRGRRRLAASSGRLSLAEPALPESWVGRPLEALDGGEASVSSLSLKVEPPPGGPVAGSGRAATASISWLRSDARRARRPAGGRSRVSLT